MHRATPSTVPGCRMPHFLVAGRPVYDLLGPDYTLVWFDSGADAGPPLPDVFNHRLLIVRPDQHVAWRGDAPPTDRGRLIARLRGVRAAS